VRLWRRKLQHGARFWTLALGPFDPSAAVIPQPYPAPDGIDVETKEGLEDFLDGLAEGRYQIAEPK
jgi:hypothetical protein